MNKIIVEIKRNWQVIVFIVCVIFVLTGIYNVVRSVCQNKSILKQYEENEQLRKRTSQIKDSLIYQVISTQRPKQIGWLCNKFFLNFEPESFDITYADFQLYIKHQPCIPYQKKEKWEYFCTLKDGTDICIDNRPYIGSPLKDRTYTKIKEICSNIKKQGIAESEN